MPAGWAGGVQRLLHAGARFTRPLTMGVRAIVVGPQGGVFLVRHSYVPGWHLPGGAVEAGETVFDALARELREEGNIALEGDAELFGLYFNRRASRRDHVALFLVRSWRQTGARAPDWEIVETGVFDPAALPDGATPATRARLREALEGAPVPKDW